MTMTKTSLFSFLALSTSFTSSSASVVDAPHRSVSVYDATVSNLSPQPFDMYILAQSWQPAFCFGKEQQYPGCRAPQSYWRSHLTLHGLWPELAGSQPPSFCSSEAFDADLIERELGIDTLHQYWPDVKYSEASPQYADFWKHEWTRHGTCSGLKQVDYFTHAINLERNETLAPTPQFVQDNVGQHVDVKKLREAFGDAALKCQHAHTQGEDDAKHASLFSQVFTCWQKDKHNVPTQRCACPPHIHSEDTCGKSSVTIPAFPAADD
ncbi:Ribonuclease [Phytophthora palmivora]|uniref:Ribonuclease n=1 Tax=Phytophthora palmivora TaxID=4796 RepID=A0A2P4YTF3_9STRA|nr:Ribonuclease [Phytophthora palmivora]